MSGIVKAPVVTALAIALPLTMPKSPLEINATLPAPPRLAPATAPAPVRREGAVGEEAQEPPVGHHAAEDHEQEDEGGRHQRGDPEDPLRGERLLVHQLQERLA